MPAVAPQPTLHGPAYSVYVRAVRMAFAEKGVGYDHESFDILGDNWADEGWRARHPFARVPVLETPSGSLYETVAITRYVDEAFPGPALQPADPWRRARMQQAISIADSYLYRPWVHGIAVPRVIAPGMGRPVDESAVAAALPDAERAADALVPVLRDLHGDGYAVTLADIHLAPMADYLAQSREGKAILDHRPALRGWLDWIGGRESFRSTRAILGQTDFGAHTKIR